MNCSLSAEFFLSCFVITTVFDLFFDFLELSVEVMFSEGCGDGSFENAHSLDLSPLTMSDVLSIVAATSTLLHGAYTLSSSGSSLSSLGAGVDDVIDDAIDDMREELS